MSSQVSAAGTATAETCEDTSYTVAGASATNSAGILWTHDGSGTITGGSETTLTPQYNPVAADGGNVVTLTMTVSGNGSCTDAVDTQALTVTDGPTADAGAPTAETCEDTAYTIAGSSATNSAGILWTHDGSGTIANGTTLTPTYTPVAADGGNVVTLTMTVSGNGSCTDAVDTQALTVTDGPTADAGTATAETCEDTSYTVAGASATNSAGILWTHDGSGTITGGSETTLTPQYNPVAADGGNVVTLTMTVSGNGSCTDAVDTQALTVTDGPTADAGAPTAETCEDTAYTIAGSSATNSAGILWTHDGSGTITDGTTLTPTYTPVAADGGNVVTLTMTVSGNGSCTDAVDTQALTVTDGPTADAGTATAETCEDTSYTVAGASATNSAGILWTHDGSGTITGGSETTLTPQYNPVAADGGNVVTLTMTVSGNGSCTDAVDTQALTVTDGPSPAIAGPPINQCDTEIFTMAATAPVVGLGTWSVFGPDPGITITNINSATTTVTGLTAGSTVTLRWTITSGTCAANFDDVTLVNDIQPVADAYEVDGTAVFNECGLTYASNANTAVGLGTWSKTTGPGTLSFSTNANDPDQTLNVDMYGSYVLRWTDVNGTCNDFDEIAVNFFETPTVSVAGTDQTGAAAVCGTSTMLTANAPTVGTGLWTILTGDGNGAFVDATNPTTSFTGSLEFTYTLTWTISNGVCTPSATIVNIEFDANPTIAAAGPDQILCGVGSFNMAANSPAIGIGSWSLQSGTATIATPGSISTAVTGVPSGTSATLRWTISNGVCADSFDEIIVTNSMPATVSVPADFAICEPVSIPLTGTIGGGATAGTWQIVSGGGTLSASAISGSTITATYFTDVSDVSTIVSLRLITDDPDGPTAPCTTSSAIQNITIDESAKVTAGADQQICEDVSAPLNGNVFGSVSTGVWSIVSGGDGNFDNSASPVTNYNPGTNDMLNGAVVTLRLTSSAPGTTCGIVFDETIVTVNKLPEVLLTGLAPVYQEDAPPVTLTGFPTTGGVGVFSGPAVVGNQFFPTVANLTPTVNTIVYTFTNSATGCTNFDSFDVIVNPITTVDFTIESSNLNAADELEICSDNGLLKLQGIPDISLGISGGFSSTDPIMQANITILSGDFFIDTDNMPSDLYDVTYTFTNTLGATSTKTRFVKVFAGPIADFTIGNFCVDSPIIFSDISVIGASPFGGNIDTWAWTFGDGTVSTLQNPTHIYANEGSYDISLTVRSDQGCVATIVKSAQTFGAVPLVSFVSSDFCNGQTTSFLGSIDWGVQIPSAITDYTWAYGDGVVESTGTANTTNHAYPTQGVYNMTMTVTTTEGCMASDTQPIGIFPFTTVDIVDEYIESFETDEGGWIAGALVTSDSSWVHGPPSGNVINSASDGVNAWWTGNNPDPNEYY